MLHLIGMPDETTQRILDLQQLMTDRLSELGYADVHSATRIGRHLAEIAVYGERFARVTLPLLLSLQHENQAPIRELVLAMKCELDELRDSLIDVDHDMHDLTTFFDADL